MKKEEEEEKVRKKPMNGKMERRGKGKFWWAQCWIKRIHGRWQGKGKEGRRKSEE